jgi:hypothetical protein
MLNYVDRPRAIIVTRPPGNRGDKTVRLGSISKDRLEVTIEPNASLTDAERREIQSLADSHKAAEAFHLQITALKYPEITGKVMGYFAGPASELEKHLIRSAIQGAYKGIRKTDAQAATPAEPPPERRQPLLPVLPTPEVLAAMLYDALAQTSSSEVKGDPRNREKTELIGQWDLIEIARTLLAKA